MGRAGIERQFRFDCFFPSFSRFSICSLFLLHLLSLSLSQDDHETSGERSGGCRWAENWTSFSKISESRAKKGVWEMGSWVFRLAFDKPPNVYRLRLCWSYMKTLLRYFQRHQDTSILSSKRRQSLSSESICWWHDWQSNMHQSLSSIFVLCREREREREKEKEKINWRLVLKNTVEKYCAIALHYFVCI